MVIVVGMGVVEWWLGCELIVVVVMMKDEVVM